MKRAHLVLLTSVLAAGVHADQIDDMVRERMKKDNIPGIALAIVKNDKVVKMQGYGYANLEHRVLVTPDTVFQSGSVGKHFTATLIMMLSDEGKLKLSDPIVKFFPEGKSKWDDVTVRHLLTHTSGLPDLPYGRMDMRMDYTEDDLVKFLVEQPVPEKVGTKFRYNNGGYVLLGILAGRVAGRFYGDQLTEKLFKPLGMATARIISEADIVPNRAAGYVPAGKELKNQPWVAPKLNTTADGSLYLTLKDMVAWDKALTEQKLVKKAWLDQMWTGAKLADGTTVKMGPNGSASYGFGWALASSNGDNIVEHGGAWQGFVSHIRRNLTKKTTVIVLANRAGAPVSQISDEAFKLLK